MIYYNSKSVLIINIIIVVYIWNLLLLFYIAVNGAAIMRNFAT